MESLIPIISSVLKNELLKKLCFALLRSSVPKMDSTHGALQQSISQTSVRTILQTIHSPWIFSVTTCKHSAVLFYVLYLHTRHLTRAHKSVGFSLLAKKTKTNKTKRKHSRYVGQLPLFIFLFLPLFPSLCPSLHLSLSPSLYFPLSVSLSISLSLSPSLAFSLSLSSCHSCTHLPCFSHSYSLFSVSFPVLVYLPN